VINTTEATGFRHLELRAPNGELERRLTTGEGVVTELVHIDEGRGEALFMGTADGVLERHLYAVPLDAPAPIERPERLTSEPGWHEVTVSPVGTRWADTWSTMDVSPSVVVRSRDGAAPFELHAPLATAAELGLVTPTLESLPAADGHTPLQVGIYRPRSASPSPPLTILWVYGGPHSQHVCNAWEMTINHWRQALVAAGFQVVAADNRGTAHRGVAFEAPINHQLGVVEVQDQAAVIEALIDRGDVDPGRIGVTGWSYGGFMTIRSMLDRPDLFTVGMAGAPVTSWDGYDTAYTERYLGNPADEPEAYERSSVVSRAATLRGTLLLIHGAVDENVHLRHTGRFLNELQAAGSSADLVLLPRARHLTSPKVLEAVLRRTIGHFRDAMSGTD
jgi:dipeptidyl-peptidase-4